MLDLLSTAGILDIQLNFFMIMNKTRFRVYDTILYQPLMLDLHG